MELQTAQDCLAGGLAILIINFSDLSDAFCHACGEAGLIPFLVEMSNEAKTCIPDQVQFVVRKVLCTDSACAVFSKHMQ